MSYPCILGRGECNGCMDCKGEDKQYFCPICGEEVDALYVSADGDIVGCDNCISYKEAWEVLDD